MSGKLTIFVIYDNPSDNPGYFVAREWEMSIKNNSFCAVPNNSPFMVEKSIDPIREKMNILCLTKLDRDENDDPCIVETWI